MGKNKEENVILNDCLIIRTDENVNINYLNELGKMCIESGLKYQIIYKPQSINYEFKKYFSVYRMKYLISVNSGERKKNEEKKKIIRPPKKKDKKEKEKDEKEIEKEEKENIEVIYTLEDYKSNKTENLTITQIKRKIGYNT